MSHLEHLALPHSAASGPPDIFSYNRKGCSKVLFIYIYVFLSDGSAYDFEYSCFGFGLPGKSNTVRHDVKEIFYTFFLYNILEADQYCGSGLYLPTFPLSKFPHALYFITVGTVVERNLMVLVITVYLIAGMYFCINMILITLSTFLAVMVINTHIRGDRKNRVPDWLRRVSRMRFIMCRSTRLARNDQLFRKIYYLRRLIFFPAETVHWRGICYGDVAVCVCVCHLSR